LIEVVDAIIVGLLGFLCFQDLKSCMFFLLCQHFILSNTHFWIAHLLVTQFQNWTLTKLFQNFPLKQMLLFVINPFVTKCYELSHAIVKDCMCNLNLKSIWFLITFANMMQLIVPSSFKMDDIYSWVQIHYHIYK
jgi:hypothetical protein